MQKVALPASLGLASILGIPFCSAVLVHTQEEETNRSKCCTEGGIELAAALGSRSAAACQS